MMNKILIVGIVLVSTLKGLVSDENKAMYSTGTIKVTVTDIESKKGNIVFMLFKNEDGFPKEIDKAFKKGTVKKYGNQASFEFTDVPYGTYAIAVFQDENGDGTINTNFIGMPKEPVGASNLTKMGKPNFSKCSFELDSSSKKISLIFII